MSTAYHPVTDGQTEVWNRCLKMYLRCFSSDQSKQWNKWLHWAEFGFNTSFHTTAGMTPFEVVYGRAPPLIPKFMMGASKVEAVEQELVDRDEILRQLRYNLFKAQQRMTKAANVHRRDGQYNIGDSVFLKFRPHRQSSAFSRIAPKLAAKYYGPFRIIARVGPVAYELQLPVEAKIHPVFHVSLLKKQ